MISREDLNKKLEEEIKKEKAIKISKKILKIFLVIMLIFSILFLYMYFIGIKFMKTNEYSIKDNNIPESFKGSKILHFTDLLYGKTIDLDELSNEIKLINPDIVIFTGNLIDNNYEINEDEIKNLNLFMKNIPYTIGKYAIYGNLDSQTYNLIMENTDFNILDNEIIKVYNNNDYINIIGINSKNEKIINQNDYSYTITLINNYDNYENYNITSNLVFAGSNLGGEIKIFTIPLVRNNKYLNNFYEFNNTKVYISNGLGSPHHMRFMNHPSINVYRLW